MMGWDFRALPCSKQEIIEECVKSICSMTCLHQSVQGNELWTIWEKKDGSKIILLFLLMSKSLCWGFKEISEEAGPHYYKCPLGFLEIAPVVNANWRTKVYEYHCDRLHNLSLRKKIKVGVIVALDNPSNEFRVTHMNPLQGVSLKERRLYRLVKSRIVSVRMDTTETAAKMVREATPTDQIWM
jgi:hypothetical protein